MLCLVLDTPRITPSVIGSARFRWHEKSGGGVGTRQSVPNHQFPLGKNSNRAASCPPTRFGNVPVHELMRGTMLHRFWLTFKDAERERRFEQRFHGWGVGLDKSVLFFMLTVREAALCRSWIAGSKAEERRGSFLLSFALPLEILIRGIMEERNLRLLVNGRTGIVVVSRLYTALRSCFTDSKLGSGPASPLHWHRVLGGAPLQFLCALGMPLKFCHQLPLQIAIALIQISSSRSPYCKLLASPTIEPVARRVAWICRVFTSLVLEDSQSMRQIDYDTSPVPCMEFLMVLNLFFGVVVCLFWWWTIELRMRVAFLVSEFENEGRSVDRSYIREQILVSLQLPWVLGVFLLPLFAMFWRILEVVHGSFVCK